jgi:hypothetical protein
MVGLRLVTQKPAARKFRIDSYRKLARKHKRADVVLKFVVLKSRR